jgi:NADPH-dependent curcumin reductase CurA
MSRVSKKILLANRPSSELSQTNFEFTEEAVRNPGEQEILVRARYFSVDPYMRNRMNDVKSYISPYMVGAALEGDVIAEVIESEHPEFKCGDLVCGMLPWQEYTSCIPTRLEQIRPTEEVGETAYLGVLGLTGLTAYFGMLNIGKPNETETVVISAAGGAVGSVAGQIAKIKKCRVIGITGSEVKTKFIVNDLGFNEAINYKSFRNIRKPIREYCPDGVDIYFDNVGGELSDAVFYQLNNFSRVVLCGQISLYNQNCLIMGPRLYAQFIVHRVKIQGFIVYDYAQEFPRARRQLSQWIKKGQLKINEQIVNGFENLPKALMSLFQGENTGKLLVQA